MFQITFYRKGAHRLVILIQIKKQHNQHYIEIKVYFYMTA